MGRTVLGPSICWYFNTASWHRPDRGAYLLCVGVKLLLGIGSDDQGEDGLHHPLVAGGQVGQKLLALPTLQFHIVGDNGGEVVVLILPALPVL